MTASANYQWMIADFSANYQFMHLDLHLWICTISYAIFPQIEQMMRKYDIFLMVSDKYLVKNDIFYIIKMGLLALAFCYFHQMAGQF